MASHGVTTSLWDHVYGTFERPGRIRVPRRLAMGWLVDEGGEVRVEYRDHYVLAGRRPEGTRSGPADAAQVAEDERRAFANEAPVV